MDANVLTTSTGDITYFQNKGLLQSDIEDLRYYLNLFDEDEERDSIYSGRKHTTRHHSTRRASLKDQAKSYRWFRPPYTDGSLASISSQATTSLVQAVLPLGIQGIFVEVTSPLGGDAADEQVGALLTTELRDRLRMPSSNFTTAILESVRDFMLYGTCVIAYEPNQAGVFHSQHYPFYITSFDFPLGSRSPSWLFSRTSNRTAHGRETVRILFTQAQHGGWKKQTSIVTSEGDKEGRTVKLGPNTLFVAREGRYNTTPYGRGSGIVALPHIVFLNWCSDESHTNTEKTNSPATVYLADTIVRSQKYGARTLDTTPHGVMSYSLTPEMLAALGGNYEPLKMLTPNPIAKQELQMDAGYAREQIRAVFSVDTYLAEQATQGATSPRTAAEITYRESLNSTQFNTKAQTIQNTLLTPLLTEILSNEVLANPDLQALGVRDNMQVKIRLITPQDLSLKEVQLARMERYIAFVSQFDPKKVTSEEWDAYEEASHEKIY